MGQWRWRKRAFTSMKQPHILQRIRISAPSVVVECSHWRQVDSLDSTIAACWAAGGAAARTARSFLLQSEHDNCGFSISVFSDRGSQLDFDFFRRLATI